VNGLFLGGLLLAAAVTANAAHAGTCTPVPANLISWYQGENKTFDAVGPNDGFIVGNVGFGSGKVGKAFVFDGKPGSYIAVPTPNLQFSLADRSFTIDTWVNFTQINTRSPFVAHDDGPTDQRKWIFWYDALGNNSPPGPALRFHINGPDLGPQDPIWVSWSPATGTWYHVAVTRELLGNNIRPTSNYSLYINGKAVATSSSPSVIEDAVLAPVQIGAAEGDGTNGAIDEVDIFDRALSQSEIATIYMAGRAGKCLPRPSVVGTTIAGIVPFIGTTAHAICRDMTTGTSVFVPLQAGSRSYNCTAAGLTVNPGDTVTITVTTTAGKAQ
jgi:hypothetical protein